MLTVRDLRASYGPIEVLHGIDLEVPGGGIFALLGPNGAGKSTFLRVVAGLHAVGSGQLMVAGKRLNGTSTDMLARRGICLIPEGRGVFPNLSVKDNLRIVTHLGTSLAQAEERAYDAFPVLSTRRSQVAGTLSGGEQQMLAMARAIVVKPTFLLLDELSSGLAPQVVEMLYSKVVEMAVSGVTVLAVEQFAHTVLAIARMGAVMVTGKVVAAGAPNEIKEALGELYLGA